MGSKQKFTDAEMIALLHIHENNVTKVAKELGVARSSIIRRRDALPVGAVITDLEEFRAKRADIFADLQQKIIAQITPKKLENASIQQLLTAFGIIYDKERLEKNQSTENIAHKMRKELTEEDKALLQDFAKQRTQKLIEGVVYDDDDERNV